MYESSHQQAVGAFATKLSEKTTARALLSATHPSAFRQLDEGPKWRASGREDVARDNRAIIYGGQMTYQSEARDIGLPTHVDCS
jgi:hypothetical protein